MIYRRREAELVRPGLNVLWEPKAKGAILKTPWFSLYVSWNRHTRRLNFAVPINYMWPLGPWRKIGKLEADIRNLKNEVIALDSALRQSADRYDKVRETNLQLRDALTLYRNA